MKKFLGLTVLLLAVLFASCNFNDFNKKGSVDFSIPIADIVALRNEVSEPTDISPDPNQTETEQYIFDFLVQIKGSAGYYAARYEQLDDVNYQEIEDAKFHFSFDELPVNQQYKIMIDVYNERKMSEEEKAKYEGRQGHALLIYSGDKDNIIVSAGQITREQLVLHGIDAYSYSNFDIVLEYKDGDKTKTQTVKLDSPETIPVGFTCYEETENETTKYTYYFKDRTDSEEDQEAIYWGYKDQKKSDWTELTGLSFKLREDSHFWGDFEFVQPVSKFNKETKQEEMDSVTLEFDDDGICPVYEYLSGESYLFNYPLSAQLKMDNATISTSMWVPIITIQTITFAKEETVVDPVDPEEAKEPEDDPTKEEPKEDPKEEPKDDPTTQEPTDDPKEEPKEETFTDTQSGEITIQESKLLFEPWNVQEGQLVRYISTVSLADILGDKKLSDDDTVVFVLKTEDEGKENLFSQYNVSQFYYQLQEDDWKTTYDGDDEGLYRNNNCINFSKKTSGSYTFVMPLNFIKDPEDYKNLQLFFDCPSNTTATSLELGCSINYCIFPASTKTFVFGLGQNYSGDTEAYPFRYELDLPLTDSLEEEQTVSVQLKGTLNCYGADDDISSSKQFTTTFDFNGEIYDGACYEVAESYKPDNNNYYHPLSQKRADGNVKSLEIVNGKFSGDGEFIFASIQAPFYDRKDESENPEHKYRFQCYIPCSNPEKILVIKDFEISIN